MSNKTFEYQEYEIISKEEMAPDIFLFRLRGKIDFLPGQFVQAALDHFGEITLAICSSPYEKNYFELCIRGCGSTSDAMIKLLPGDMLKIRGPYGNGWPIKALKGREVLLISGGMGIVPLRPVLFELIQNKRLCKKVSLISAFKTPNHILFLSDLKNFKKGLDNFKLYVEHNDGSVGIGTGMITEPIKLQKINPKQATVLMCGPDVMIPFCNEELFKKDVKENQIYISYERRMECGIGVCQHCSCGKFLVCQDGPVFRFDQIKEEIRK